MHTKNAEDCDATEGNRDREDQHPPTRLPKYLIASRQHCAHDVSLLDWCYSVFPADATVQIEC